MDTATATQSEQPAPKHVDCVENATTPAAPRTQALSSANARLYRGHASHNECEAVFSAAPVGVGKKHLVYLCCCNSAHESRSVPPARLPSPRLSRRMPHPLRSDCSSAAAPVTHPSSCPWPQGVLHLRSGSSVCFFRIVSKLFQKVTLLPHDPQATLSRLPKSLSEPNIPRKDPRNNAQTFRTHGPPSSKPRDMNTLVGTEVYA